jgi:hypothetical protein
MAIQALGLFAGFHSRAKRSVPSALFSLSSYILLLPGSYSWITLSINELI